MNHFLAFSVLLISSSITLFCVTPSFANQDVIEFDNSYNPYGSKNKRREKDSTERDYVTLNGHITKNPNLSAAQLKQLHFLKQEPSFPAAERQMLLFMGLPSGQEFKRYRAQARLRNILPEVSSDYDFNRQRYFSNAYGSSNDILVPGPNTQPPNNTQTYNHSELSNDSDFSNTGYGTKGLSADVNWNLQGLIYDNEVTDLISEQRRIAGIRNDLIDQIHQYYFDRRRKQVQFIISPPVNEGEEVIQDLEIEELTAKIDGMTGGWFSKAIESKEKREMFSDNNF